MTRSIAETSFPFQPAPGLGNAHVQSLIASSALRRRKVVRMSEQVRAVEEGRDVPAIPDRARREVVNYFAGLRFVEKNARKKKIGLIKGPRYI